MHPPIINPTRIQRSRRKGAITPEGAIYVGRPTLWGNPFMSRRFGHMKSVRLHERWLRGDIAALSLERIGFCPAEIDTLLRLRVRVLTGLHRLAGHHLQCWCPLSAPCHADLLLMLAPVHVDYERHAA